MNNRGTLSSAVIFTIVISSLIIAIATIQTNSLHIQKARQQRSLRQNNILQTCRQKWHNLLEQLLLINGTSTINWEKTKAAWQQDPSFSCSEEPFLDNQSSCRVRFSYSSENQILNSLLTIRARLGTFNATEIPLTVNSSSQQNNLQTLQQLKNPLTSFPLMSGVQPEDQLTDFLTAKLFGFDWMKIRKFLNLPLSSEPLPQDIYLLGSSNSVDLIFIQAPQSRVDFYCNDQAQVISINLNDETEKNINIYVAENCYYIKYNEVELKVTSHYPLFMFNGSCEINSLEIKDNFQLAFIIYGSVLINLKQINQNANHSGQLLLITRAINPFTNLSHCADLKIKNRQALQLKINVFCDGSFSSSSEDLTIKGSLNIKSVAASSPVNIEHQEFKNSPFLMRDIFFIEKISINYLWGNDDE